MSKWMDEARPDQPVGAVAVETLAARLERVAHYLPLAAQKPEEDIEHVHQLRVSTRRAMSVLELYADLIPKKAREDMRRRLKAIRRAAGGARDFDVMLERLEKEETPDTPFIEYVQRRRTGAQPRLVAELEAQSDFEVTVEELIRKTKTDVTRFGPWAKKALGAALDKFIAAAPAGTEDMEALHQFRIEGKALRYTIELLVGAFDPALKEELYPKIEKLQKRLGVINDLVSAQAYFQAWMADPASQLDLSARIRGAEDATKAKVEEFEGWWTPELVTELRDIFENKLAAKFEIEKKYLLDSLPPDEVLTASQCNYSEISQTYILNGPGELRLRRRDGAITLTVKGDGDLKRSEWGVGDVPPWVASLLEQHGLGKTIDKRRYTIPHGRQVLELDVYSGHLEGLITMECEFETLADVETFELPDWAAGAKDVTGDGSFKNKKLAVDGWTKES